MPYHDYGWHYKLHINDYCRAFSENAAEQQIYRPYYIYVSEGCDTVDIWALRNSVHDVPNQANSWSCGVVAGARAAAAAGMPIRNYQDFHNYAQTHALGGIECGPGPGNLYNMMQKSMDSSHAPHGFGFGLDITDDWFKQEQLLRESLRRHRPMLVLFEVDQRQLHWAVVVGCEKAAPDNLLLLNSNGALYTMRTAELQKRMDLKDHITSWIPIVSDRLGRFNSISCTWGELPDNTHEIRNQGNRHAHLRGNHSAGFNVADTVLGAPVMLLTPIGLTWRLFRGLGKRP